MGESQQLLEAGTVEGTEWEGRAATSLVPHILVPQHRGG